MTERMKTMQRKLKQKELRRQLLEISDDFIACPIQKISYSYSEMSELSRRYVTIRYEATGNRSIFIQTIYKEFRALLKDIIDARRSNPLLWLTVPIGDFGFEIQINLTVFYEHFMAIMNQFYKKDASTTNECILRLNTHDLLFAGIFVDEHQICISCNFHDNTMF